MADFFVVCILSHPGTVIQPHRETGILLFLRNSWKQGFEGPLETLIPVTVLVFYHTPRVSTESHHMAAAVCIKECLHCPSPLSCVDSISKGE